VRELRLDVCNNTKVPRHLYMEPSARHYVVPPGRTFRIVFTSEAAGVPQVDINDDSISVWCFANSDYRILEGDQEVREL
jgi:hypothetical protein